MTDLRDDVAASGGAPSQSAPQPSTARRAPRWAARGLVLSGIACGFVAAFHACAIVAPEISEPSPRWRHALFVAVNLFFAASFVRRDRRIALPYLALAAQQAWSHGTAFMAARRAGHFDLQSVVVLASLPLIGVLVAYGRAPSGAR